MQISVGWQHGGHPRIDTEVFPEPKDRRTLLGSRLAGGHWSCSIMLFIPPLQNLAKVDPGFMGSDVVF